MKTLSKANVETPITKYSPEVELLLCCSRTTIDDATCKRITTLIQHNINWEYFIQLAVQHKVTPLVYTSLNSVAPEMVPEQVLNSFRNFFHTNTQRNLQLTGELLKILTLLETNGIEAVPYKGPVLANSVYKNIALRQFGDLDIIVQLKDILKVKKILLDLGYKRKNSLNEVQEQAFFQSKREHTFDFINYEKAALIEIHWRITPRYSSIIEPKHFWHYLESRSFMGKNVNSLPLDYWLPILCVHGSRHCWERLTWLCDISELIKIHPEINWDQTIRFASELGCRRMLFLGLFLAQDLIGVTLPSQVLEQVKAEKQISALATKVGIQLFDYNRGNSQFMGTTLYHMQARERLQDKAIYLQSFFDWLIHPDQWNWSNTSDN